MLQLNISLSTTEVNNLDLSASLSPSAWDRLVDSGALAGAVGVSLNPAAGAATIAGIVPDDIEASRLLLKNIQPPGGFAISLTGLSDASDANAQFASSLGIVPGQTVTLRRRAGKWAPAS